MDMDEKTAMLLATEFLTESRKYDAQKVIEKF